jgi:hypothetical protein
MYVITEKKLNLKLTEIDIKPVDIIINRKDNLICQIASIILNNVMQRLKLLKQDLGLDYLNEAINMT